MNKVLLRMSKATVPRIFKTIVSLFLFLLFATLITIAFWQVAAKDYLNLQQPVGGDYFNSLTYAQFFKDQLPLPPTGWIPFWNEGDSVIGGYPFLAFYFIHFLAPYFDLATAMELFASLSFGLFFIFSLLLFRQVSRNWLIAVSLTLILIVTKATFYPLTTGGFISSATAQWYLPLGLFLIFKFSDSKNIRYLVLGSIIGGLSLLHHGPINLLMTILPSIAVILFLPNLGNKLTNKATLAFIYLIIASTIGSIGLYSVFLQTYFGSGGSSCLSPECWGVYPKHLNLWLGYLTPIFLAIFLTTALVLKIVKKKANLWLILPGVAGFLIFFIYGLAAYSKLINGLANVIFPTRTFWAMNLFLLLIAASSFRVLKDIYPKLSLIPSVITILLLGLYLYQNPPTIHQDRTNTDPVDIANYIIPKYKTRDFSSLVPNWMPLHDSNWRLDTFNSGLTHWWNYISSTPSTRGYSNHPIGIHKDWQYFLQTATRDPEGKNAELIKNRAMFLIDAYGIGFRENSIASYPKSILEDPNIVSKQESGLRGFSWYQFSKEIVTPIVSPTNKNALLFIGDDAGYESFIRAIAMTNLNSNILIPVKGPKNVASVTQKELKNFSGVVLYRFSGNKFSHIEEFVKNGGFVFIETGSLRNPLTDGTSAIIPFQSLENSEAKGAWDVQINQKSDLLKQINTKDFSDLSFEGGPWKVSSGSKLDLRSDSEALITQKEAVYLATRKLGNGNVIWSGTNLMFHIVSSDNFAEAKLLSNLLTSSIKNPEQKVAYKVTRPKPEQIIIEGKNITGIYFKENYHSGWKANLDGQKIKVYKAGLDFMYIPIDQRYYNQDISISLRFVGNFTTWALFYLTIASLIFSAVLIIYPKPVIFIGSLLLLQFRKNIGFRFKNWLKEE